MTEHLHELPPTTPTRSVEDALAEALWIGGNAIQGWSDLDPTIQDVYRAYCAGVLPALSAVGLELGWRK